eukprot:1042458-Prymnesium_polylepis.1
MASRAGLCAASAAACIVASASLLRPGFVSSVVQPPPNVTGRPADTATARTPGSTSGPAVAKGTPLVEGWQKLTSHSHRLLARRRRMVRPGSLPESRLHLNVVVSLAPGGALPLFAARILDGPKRGCWRLSDACVLAERRARVTLTIYQKSSAIALGDEQRNGSQGPHHTTYFISSHGKNVAVYWYHIARRYHSLADHE